jgi:hypothetical protein
LIKRRAAPRDRGQGFLVDADRRRHS